MIEVVAVCEGQTEETFVRDILAPPLALQRVFVQPRLIPTSPHGRGGALTGQRVLRYLRNTLRQREDAYVTTFFDLYALRSDFPGQSVAAAQTTDPVSRAAGIETGFHEAVVREAACRPGRFIPHIQPYEFESLLFADVEVFGEVEPAWKSCVETLRGARLAAKSPEHINDGQNTHPSARLQGLSKCAKYRKVAHGSAIAACIGLERIRAECRHFDTWLTRIESLPALCAAV